MDIVERLRDDESMYDADDVDLHLDAADEIERLRQQNSEVLAAYERLRAMYEDLHMRTPIKHFLIKEEWDAAINKATGGE